MYRRSVISLGALAATTGLVGCSALDENGQTGVVLTHVELANATGESQAFFLLVEYDGESIYDAVHRVGVGDDEYGTEEMVVEIDSPSEPGIVELEATAAEQTRPVGFDDDHSIEQFDGERVTVIFTLVRRGDQDDPTFTYTIRLTDS